MQEQRWSLYLSSHVCHLALENRQVDLCVGYIVCCERPWRQGHSGSLGGEACPPQDGCGSQCFSCKHIKSTAQPKLAQLPLVMFYDTLEYLKNRVEYKSEAVAEKMSFEDNNSLLKMSPFVSFPHNPSSKCSLLVDSRRKSSECFRYKQGKRQRGSWRGWY